MSKEDFEKCKRLYKFGVSIKNINPLDNQTYKVLVTSNVDIRIIDRDKHLAEISMIESLKQISKDSLEYSNRFIYAIPLQTIKGTIIGFIFRSVFGKSYATITRDFKDKDKKVPIMFGFYKDFEDFDQHSSCKPIIVCEGLKDCIALKQIYPYVLSNNTSSMGINLQVLANLTNKFILIYDNDKAGQDGMDLDTRNLRKLKYHVIQISPKDCYKDSADCYENKEDFSNYAKEIQEKVRLLDEEPNNMLLSRKVIKR